MTLKIFHNYYFSKKVLRYENTALIYHNAYPRQPAPGENRYCPLCAKKGKISQTGFHIGGN